VRTVVLLVMLGAATAHAGPDVKRKATPATDKFAKAAAEAFALAIAADEKGDLDTALGLYTKAQAIAPHPNTVYNIADVYRRQNKLPEAIEAFETYLAILPSAQDRKECEAIIDGLVATPGTLNLITSPQSDPDSVAFKDFYVLVDGEIKVKVGTKPGPLSGLRDREGFALVVPPGRHAIDVVSAISYGHEECEVKAGKTEVCSIRAKPRIDGRFVFRSGDHSNLRALIEKSDEDRERKSSKKMKTITYERFELPPGKRRLPIRDRSFECPALTIDVPTGTHDVGYLFVTSKEYDGFQRCRKLEVRQHKLHFD